MTSFASASLSPLRRAAKAILLFFGLRRWLYLLRERRLGVRWTGEGIKHRQYRDEAQYLAHQRSKLPVISPERLAAYDARLRAALYARLEVSPASRVLCLAARQGGEVRAFLDRGCFAVGVDLNPGAENPYVLVGDFHRLQFADASVDLVYTNSLDHVRDLPQLCREIRRVLLPGGRLLVDAVHGPEDGGRGRGHWEAMDWPSIVALIQALEGEALTLVSRQPITVPWPGEELALVPTGTPSPLTAADSFATERQTGPGVVQ